MNRHSFTKHSLLSVTTALLCAGLLWSGWHPYDRLTWFMESLPVMLVLPVMWATRTRFPLTSLLTIGIGLHGFVLMIGGAYTYARVPFGFELAELLGMQRNPYDKIGHFFQGLVPALAAREILIRGRHIRLAAMRDFLVLCVVLAISSSYELIEWAAALSLGQGADEFLATQGDPWDTQSDMLFALIGGLVTVFMLRRWHDAQIAAVMRPRQDA